VNAPNTHARRQIAWWEAALMLRGQTAADDRNIKLFSLWSFLWAVGFSLAVYLVKNFPEVLGPFGWGLAVVPIALAVPVLRAFLRYLREADEFTRKVQLEGIALGYGIGFMFCMSYYTLQQFGAPSLPVIAAAVPMALGWALGSLLVASRYR
jgi:small-conductance mechanosensitive channel